LDLGKPELPALPSLLVLEARTGLHSCFTVWQQGKNHITRLTAQTIWRMDNDLDVGLLTGYVLYWLPVELEFMDLDTFPH
jgi:hypothetical protein